MFSRKREWLPVDMRQDRKRWMPGAAGNARRDLVDFVHLAFTGIATLDASRTRDMANRFEVSDRGVRLQ